MKARAGRSQISGGLARAAVVWEGMTKHLRQAARANPPLVFSLPPELSGISLYTIVTIPYLF